MKKLDLFILTLILVIALVTRLYKINTPLADLHSWRQADTSAVTRNFVRSGIDFLHPRFDDLSSTTNINGAANPQGYRFVEFPVYNAIVASVYKLYPAFSIEIYGRLVTIAFSLFIIAVIYYLALKESSRLTAVVASSVYAIFPYFVFFSRVILPETTSLSFAMLSIFFLYLFSDSKRRILPNLWFMLSLLCFATALLVKPPAIFYGITLLAVFYKKYGFSFIKKPSFYLYFILGILPLLLWRQYIQQFPEGIPPSEWLITKVNTSQGQQNIFFRPAFFRWIFYERINMAILGGYLTFFFIFGILAKQKKYILTGILISAMAYLFTFQGGNIQHEYYQTLILPVISLFIGLGVSTCIEHRRLFVPWFILYPMIIAIFGFSLFFSFYKIRGYYSYPQELPQIANIVKTLTNPDDKIVTDRLGDTTLLYLIDRKGSGVLYKDPKELKQLGYTYLVTLDPNRIKSMKEEKYTVKFENSTFALFAL